MCCFRGAPLSWINDTDKVLHQRYWWLRLASSNWSVWSWENLQYIPRNIAHGFCFAVLCCGYTLTDFPISIRLTSLALWQSNDCPSASKATLMNMDKYLMWIHYERLHNHNEAKHNKPVCIFLGIYCIYGYHYDLYEAPPSYEQWITGSIHEIELPFWRNTHLQVLYIAPQPRIPACHLYTHCSEQLASNYMMYM